MTDDHDVRPGRGQFVVLAGQGPQVPAVEGVPHYGAEGVAVAALAHQDGLVLGFSDQQPLIGDAGVVILFVVGVTGRISTNSISPSAVDNPETVQASNPGKARLRITSTTARPVPLAPLLVRPTISGLMIA